MLWLKLGIFAYLRFQAVTLNVGATLNERGVPTNYLCSELSANCKKWRSNPLSHYLIAFKSHGRVTENYVPYLSGAIAIFVAAGRRRTLVAENYASCSTLLFTMSTCPPYAPFFGFAGVASAVSALMLITHSQMRSAHGDFPDYSDDF